MWSYPNADRLTLKVASGFFGYSYLSGSINCSSLGAGRTPAVPSGPAGFKTFCGSQWPTRKPGLGSPRVQGSLWRAKERAAQSPGLSVFMVHILTQITLRVSCPPTPQQDLHPARSTCSLLKHLLRPAPSHLCLQCPSPPRGHPIFVLTRVLQDIQPSHLESLLFILCFCCLDGLCYCTFLHSTLCSRAVSLFFHHQGSRRGRFTSSDHGCC